MTLTVFAKFRRWIKTYQQIVSLLVLLAIYFVLRLVFIFQIPYFGDEALITGWSLEIAKNIRNLFLPVSYGNSPLFSWLTVLLLSFSKNQLIAGRLVSVLSGAVILLISYFCLEKIFKVKSVFFWSLLYILIPMMFVYNRLALFETLLVSCIFAAAICSYKYLLKPNNSILILYAVSLTLATLTKQIGLITIPAVFVATLLVERKINKQTFKLFIASIIPVIFFLLVMGVYKNKSASFLSDYVFFSTNFGNALILLKKNLWLTFYWLKYYYAWPFLGLSAFGVILGLWKGNRAEKYFNTVLIVFVVVIVAIDKFYFPRHTLVFAPFLLIGAAIGAKYIAKLSTVVSAGIIALVLITLFISTAKVMVNPETSGVLALEDKFQFYEDWTSGKLLPELAAYIDRQTEKRGQITVWVDSDFYYYALPTFFKNKGAVTIRLLPASQNEFSNLSRDVTQAQYVIFNRTAPFVIPFAAKSERQLSSRHLVIIYQLN